MLTLGLRRGEVLGLSWTDVDLGKARSLTVRRSLARSRSMPGTKTRIVVGDVKTARSRRTMHLPDPVVDVLKAHKAKQALERLAAAEWQDHGLVFSSRIGTPLDPDNFARRFVALAEKAKLGHWHPHEARHSAASIMLAQGVPLQVVSEVLGHSSIRLTKDVYGHLEAAARQEATEATASVLLG